MLKFLVFDGGKPAAELPVRNAYLLGADGSALRADIAFDARAGAIVCRKRDVGAAALAIQRPVGAVGELTLQTCLLPERDEPYVLSVELARHRLLTIYTKLEEWAMFEIEHDHPFVKRLDRAKSLFIDALCYVHREPAKADEVALESLVTAVDGSEELALAHADLLLARRQDASVLPRHPVGVGVSYESGADRLRSTLVANFDSVSVPLPWKHLAPAEHDYRWQAADTWAEWARRSSMHLVAGPLVSFDPMSLPDWAYVFEHDYDTMRDVIYEHVERVVTRYSSLVTTWNVVSGLHINNHFTFAFDQLLDLTRMITMLVKKIQPRGRVFVELREPFGEYYADNSRAIPPLMYADLLVQGAIELDGFIVRMLMGQAVSGQYTRDLMQVSNMLDQFSSFGKPLRVKYAAPSEVITEMMIASPDPTRPVDANSGFWRRPWSQLVQAHWLEAMAHIALSKPYVEAVVWDEMIDHPDAVLPLSGLITEDLQPKRAFGKAISVRRGLLGLPPMGSGDQRSVGRAGVGEASGNGSGSGRA